MKETYWEVSFGTYPGILLGFRTYQEETVADWDGDEHWLQSVTTCFIYR